MDKIQNTYKNLIREEVESPEVQKARDAFLLANFPHKAPVAAGSPWKLFFSPSLRLALVGCCALLVLIKTGTIDTALNQQSEIVTTPVATQSVSEVAPNSMPAEKAIPAAPEITHANSTRIKKLSSQMGATVAYQKHFPDVQITVVWVLPQGA